MKKQNSVKEATSSPSPVWSKLEGFIHHHIEVILQRVLEEEVTEVLGRRKSERAQGLEGATGYRNGHGKPRRVSTTAGTFTVRRPRVRDTEDRFESKVLPLFQRHTEGVGKLLPELYLHGLAEGDFDMALRALLGDGAPLSPSSIARLKGDWQTEFDAWRQRPLTGAEGEVVYLWVDGIYVKAGLEKEKAAVLVAIGALRDGRKVVLAVEAGHRESTEAWTTILRSLKTRGMGTPRMVVGDGALGVWGALANVFPEASEQRCWNHRIVNVLDRVPKKEQRQAKLILREIPYAETLAEAERLRGKFRAWCEKKGCTKAADILDTDWARMVAFYALPKEHWKHLRTTNPVESPFASVRLRTDAAKRFKKVDNANAILWKLLLVAEKNFRRLDAAHLLGEVAEGAKYENGIRIRKPEDPPATTMSAPAQPNTEKLAA